MADRPDRRLSNRLARGRPEPSRDFTLSLQDHLQALASDVRRPAHLWPLVLVYVACGVVLLLLAALGAVGTGPLG